MLIDLLKMGETDEPIEGITKSSTPDLGLLSISHLFEENIARIANVNSLNVMIRVSQFVRNSELCHLFAKSLNRSRCL